MLQTSTPSTSRSTINGLVDETGAPPSPPGSGRNLRVIVAGGGIGGLSAAIALRRSGHEVVALERAPRLDPIGAGITLFANAMDALERLGVAHAVRADGAAARQSAVLTSDSRELTTLSADLLYVCEKTGTRRRLRQTEG